MSCLLEFGGGGGGTPAGPSGAVQFNNAGAFGGDSGFSYAGSGQATLALGTITTNRRALTITATFNNAATVFDAPLFMNVTNTASNPGSFLFDLQLNGISLISQRVDGTLFVSGAGGAASIALQIFNNSSTGFTSFNTNATDMFTMQAANAAVVFAAGQSIGFTSTGSINVPDVGLTRIAPAVIEFTDGAAGGNTNGWLNWAGEARTAAAQNFTSTTTFATVTGLSVNVLAGRTYHFVAHIPVTAGGNAGGIKVNIAGTATATTIIYDVCAISNNAITGQAQPTTLGAANAGSVLGAATGFVVVDGVITVNAAGTLLVQAAQNTSNATSTTIGQGASFFVDDQP